MPHRGQPIKLRTPVSRRFQACHKWVLQNSACLTVLFLLCAPTAGANSLSEQLLHSYFATAGACTTSQVQSIVDTNGIVVIELDIEPSTKLALQAMEPTERDDWFSLHCPPEIHGVWRQKSPPSDIKVRGPLDTASSHELSCSQYQRRENKRQISIRDRILEHIDALLNRQ